MFDVRLVDLARCELASDALHDGAESILFIDSDIAFDSADALRVLARPEPVVAGVYAKKNRRDLACLLADGIKNVVFGSGAPGRSDAEDAASLYDALRRDVAPLFYGDPTGFARVRRAAMALNGSYFTTERMVRRYAERAYWTDA